MNRETPKFVHLYTERSYESHILYGLTTEGKVYKWTYVEPEETKSSGPGQWMWYELKNP